MVTQTTTLRGKCRNPKYSSMLTIFIVIETLLPSLGNTNLAKLP